MTACEISHYYLRKENGALSSLFNDNLFLARHNAGS